MINPTTLQAIRSLGRNLPENSSSRFNNYYSCADFLRGTSWNEYFLPSNADISEYRLCLLEIINENPNIATHIRFNALCMLTENHHMQNLPALMDLYAEILGSDRNLLNYYEDSYTNLVFLAAIYDQLPLLQILRHHNLTMKDVIRDEIKPGDDPCSPFHLVEVGKTAAHAYLNRFENRGSFSFHVDTNRAIQVLAILLYHYTKEEITAFIEFSHGIHAIHAVREQLEQVLNNALEVKNELYRQAQKEAKEGMLAFMWPATVLKHKGVPSAPVLQSFLDRCGDNGVPGIIYSFLKPAPLQM